MKIFIPHMKQKLLIFVNDISAVKAGSISIHDEQDVLFICNDLLNIIRNILNNLYLDKAQERLIYSARSYLNRNDILKPNCSNYKKSLAVISVNIIAQFSDPQSLVFEQYTIFSAKTGYNVPTIKYLLGRGMCYGLCMLINRLELIQEDAGKDFLEIIKKSSGFISDDNFKNFWDREKLSNYFINIMLEISKIQWNQGINKRVYISNNYFRGGYDISADFQEILIQIDNVTNSRRFVVKIFPVSRHNRALMQDGGHAISIVKISYNRYTVFDPNLGFYKNLTWQDTLLTLKMIKSTLSNSKSSFHFNDLVDSDKTLITEEGRLVRIVNDIIAKTRWINRYVG